MDRDYLIDCIENEGESSFFDFKKDIYDFKNINEKREFIKDILCFANGQSIGDKYIITGVKLYNDNTTRDIVGITESKINDGAIYQNIIDDYVEPSLIVDFKVIEYNNRKIGIFKIGSNNNDRPYMLKKKFADLEVGFMKIRVGQRNANITRRDLDKMYSSKIKEESNLVLKGIVNNQVSSSFEINNIDDDLFDDKNIKFMEKTIKNLIDYVSKIHLKKKSKVPYEVSFFKDVSIDDTAIKEIEKYASFFKIELSEDFFDLGNLGENHLSINYVINGTDEEKLKYKSINKLYDEIKTYNGIIKLKKKFAKIYYSELLIENIGNHFDDEIQITLKIKDDCYVNFLDFPVPDENIIEMITENDYLDRWIKNKKHKDVNEYNSKDKSIEPNHPQDFRGTMPGEWICPEPQEYIDYYHEYINYLIDYDTVFMDGYYYVKLLIKKINPNEKIFLPTRLFFTKDIKSIDYEIISKYNANMKKKTINIDNK